MPEHSDFGVCKLLVEFLEKFKVKTDIVSASSKPLAHLFFREILDVDKHLREWGVHLDFCVKDIHQETQGVNNQSSNNHKYAYISNNPNQVSKS